MRTWQKALAAGAVVAALVGGGAIAFAATQTTPPANAAQSFLDDVASHLGVTPAALKSALQAAELDRLNQAVQSGKISQQQADAIRARIASGKVGFGAFGGHRPWRGAATRGVLQTAADYLGMKPADLMTQLRAGKTLAQIANATPGKSADGLQAALYNAAKDRLDKAVQAGKLTADQEQQMLQKLQQRLPQLLNRTWKAPAGHQDQTSGTQG